MSANADMVVQALQSIAQAMMAQAEAIRTVFPQQTSVSTTATAGAQTLPANPAGFIDVAIPNGNLVKVPYYNA